MNVNILQKQEFLDLAFNRRSELLAKIEAPEAFVVKQFYAGEEILRLRKIMFDRGMNTQPSWHPLHDDCPDYHRLHDDYPNAYVKSRMHGFYNHGWYQHNAELLSFFKEIFLIKNFVGGFKPEEFISNKPSNGFVARVNFQHYPCGGGYMAEHIDPVGKHAHLQTLIQASQIGVDYQRGGNFARMRPGEPKFLLDAYTSPGDLMVMSPNIPHGVDPVDPDLAYDWQTNNGRWVVIPIVVSSDYESTAAKPLPVSSMSSAASDSSVRA